MAMDLGRPAAGSSRALHWLAWVDSLDARGACRGLPAVDMRILLSTANHMLDQAMWIADYNVPKL
jgi:hypothetical protein